MASSFDLSRPSPKTVLQLLTKPRLVEVSRELGVPVKPSATKDDQVKALAQTARAPLPSIVRTMGRDELKLACRAHGLDDRGRSREELARRLLEAARAVTEPPADSSTRTVLRLMPERGDIVAVRQRQYLVTEVVPPATDGAMTVVRLVCLDDDAQGRSLEVLWELELGARVLQPEAQGLGTPTRLDEPRQFAAYFHALKWNRVTATDGRLFQAPFRAGIDLKAYQLTPLQKALELPRANLFIADDVGLGKTIEAGLVVQELLLRQRIDWVLIVCPAAVTLQWKTEMERRFGLGFEIYNRDFVTRRRQERGFATNPWTTHNRFIVSYQTFRRPEYRDPLLHLLEQKRARSLLLLDEAHTAAPSTATKYAVDSNTTKAMADLAPRFEHRLFLSATPHNGHSTSFSALLEMLDPQRFLRGTAITGPDQLTAVMVRRLKSDLLALGTGDFPARRLVQVDLTHDGTAWSAHAVRDDGAATTTMQLGKARPAELELGRLLAEYTTLACPKTGRGRLVFINLQKRLLSSVEAFARTLERHVASLQARTKAPEARGDADDDDSDDDLSSDAQELAAERMVAGSSAALPPPDARARALLDQMQSLAQQHRSAPDAKVRALLAWIREHQCPAVDLGGAARGASGKWTDRRLIVFTEYGHTKSYLLKLLSSACEGTHLGEERIRVFDGGMTEDSRAQLQEEFNGAPSEHPVRILLATDAAREGVNLQGQCADLFHFDLPWNPARLEQRNGRIDRTLQAEKEVRCHYFFYPQRAEDRVLRTVVDKIGRIQEELGSAGNVVFEGIAALLERGGLGTEVARRIDEEAARVRATSKAAQELEAHRARDLEQQIQQAARILNNSRKVLELDPKLLRDAIDVGLALAGAGPLTPGEALAEEPGLPTFRLPNLGESWASTLDSARPPRRREEPPWEWRKRPPLPVVFEAPKKLSTPVVHLHLQHPIVQRILGRFLAQGYSAHDLARVTVLRNPDDATPRVIALGRLSVFGHGAARLHDQILAVASAFSLTDPRLAPFGEEEDAKAVEHLEKLLAASPTLAGVDAKVQDKLRALAPAHFAALWSSVEQEADAQAHEVERKLRLRGEAEAEALRKIIREQMALADRTLNAQQPLVFTDAERLQKEQLERDRKWIQKRREALGRELEAEPAGILRSYEILRRRVEPVGLIYLWPKTR